MLSKLPYQIPLHLIRDQISDLTTDPLTPKTSDISAAKAVAFLFAFFNTLYERNTLPTYNFATREKIPGVSRVKNLKSGPS